MFILFVLSILITFGVYRSNEILGLLLILLFILMLYLFKENMEHIYEEINKTIRGETRRIRDVQADSLNRAPVAIILYDNNERIRWVNPEFQHIYGSQGLLGEEIKRVDEELFDLLSLDSKNDEWQIVEFKKKFYKVIHQKEEQAIYLLDVDYEEKILRTREYDQLAVGYLFFDQYDELLQSMSDSEGAKLDSLLMEDLNRWANEWKVFLKRLDDERFITITNVHSLKQLEKDKFSFFQTVYDLKYLQNAPMSISQGIAYPDTDYYSVNDLFIQAQLNLDLALGRGGNQVVVRSEEGQARFYGGKSNPTERRTSIRSRLVYQALMTSIDQADQVFVTGHVYPDLDSMASAMGVYQLVSESKKETKIIIQEDELNHDVQQLLNIPGIQDNMSNAFINYEEAKEMINDRTLIIMVDHHRPSLSEGRDLINDHEVVIIDHHRRSEEFPENSVLTFIEPYASSTAELIAEFFMHMPPSNKPLNSSLATGLLGGMIVDTNNFTRRTGSRTFNAASYLKSRGAKTDTIQRILKEDLEHIQQRNELVDRMDYLGQGYAVTASFTTNIVDNITASQAADEMLKVKNVEASFVIYQRDKKTVGVSARSLGEINVQTIMEKMGGGGHLSNAATQIKNHTIADVSQQLRKIIHDLQEE